MIPATSSGATGSISSSDPPGISPRAARAGSDIRGYTRANAMIRNAVMGCRAISPRSPPLRGAGVCVMVWAVRMTDMSSLP